MEQMTIFELMFENYKIKKPIRLIEAFAGYGSQSLALDYLGVEYESYKTIEWAYKSIQAYKDIHFTNDNTDYSKDLTFEEVVSKLAELGISADYNKPMTYDEIKRKGETFVRQVYNNIKATHNLVNISSVHGEDLELDPNYENILTYSFPCQDLSLAGLGKGMEKGSNTRSGLLWQVERILDECKELGTLPSILIMENVPEVVGTKNIKDFQSWRYKLEQLGYSNYLEILNGKDYGIPQNRRRAFMVSILGEWNYTFARKLPLEIRLKHLLEKQVDESFYLSEEKIEKVKSWKGQENPFEDIEQDRICSTITTHAGKDSNSMQLVEQTIAIKNATKKGYLNARNGDGVDISSRMETHRGTVQQGTCQTLTTMGGEDVGVVVRTYDYAQSDTLRPTEESRTHIGNDISGTLLSSGNHNGVIVVGNYSPSNHNASRVVDEKGLAPTVMENHGTVTAVQIKEDLVPKLVGGIGEKKSNGGKQYYQQDRIYDSDGIAMCLQANMPNGSYNYTINNDQETLKMELCNKLVKDGLVEEGDVVKHSYTNQILEGKKKCVEKSDGIMIALTTRGDCNGVCVNNKTTGLRIRKLTPKECFRLMGVKDKDFNKAQVNQSNASLYHLAGDSIITTCLMAIFGKLLDIDYESKIKELVEDLKEKE